MEEDLLKIKKLLFEYINIILKEYPCSARGRIEDAINNNEEIVKYNDSLSISFFVSDGILLLPKSAYNIFPLLKQYKNYGTDLNNHRNIDDYLDTNTTYYDYINHLIEGALSVYDYFEESLLHEAMHICGSQGGTPLEEGINELKTRELAQKYNIRIAAIGYSKEVEISKRIQKIIGKKIMDELTFIPRHKRKAFLIEKTNLDIAELYELISKKMIEKSKNYYKQLREINDPFEKARLYEDVDYREIYEILDKFLNKNNHAIYSR